MATMTTQVLPELTNPNIRRFKRMPKHHKLSKKKALEMLRHGEARGHKLSKKQKRLFGFVAGGGKPTRLRKKK